MANARFEPDLGGYRDVLDSSGVQGVLDAYADGIREAATAALSPDWGDPAREPHFESGEFTVKTGATGRYVRSVTAHARRAEASRDKVLTKALRSA